MPWRKSVDAILVLFLGGEAASPGDRWTTLPCREAVPGDGGCMGTHPARS